AVEWPVNWSSKVKIHIIGQNGAAISNLVFPVTMPCDYGASNHNGETEEFYFHAPDSVLYVAGHNIYYGMGDYAATKDTTVLRFSESAVSVHRFERQSAPQINLNRSLGTNFDILGRQVSISSVRDFFPGVRITRFANGYKARVSVK
ncbi:MAG TPA: hypothetical protein VMC41_01645, partial [Candidatus Nanoarchaeia archaeon]|nr:hypothetical protein [Candidatus Nanoarchaeia archaeon]